jgi:hypothetical protein
MSARESRADVLIIGAPKAGTSALHAALAQHPQIYASPVKEPKYYMCWDAPPPAYRGPGDAHSNQEWMWRRADYEALFREAPEDAVRLESTPFNLYMRGARRRIAEELPEAKLIVIVRDPIDRAYSNWMHLWVDGLEPISDFVDAWHAEDRRVAAGWAPFWHYRRLGRYGEQLADLFGLVERERVFVLRYRQLVSHPDETLDRVARFLDIAEDQVTTIPPDNARPFVEPGLRAAVLGRVIRAGATAASYASPQIWRRASKPLVSLLQHGGRSQRPKLAPEQRTALLGDCLDDIALLEQTLGESFEDWRSAAGRGSFAERTQTAPS